MAQSVKKQPTCPRPWFNQSQEDTLGKEMATYFSIAWEISWIEEPDGLLSMGLTRVGCDLATKPQM